MKSNKKLFTFRAPLLLILVIGIAAGCGKKPAPEEKTVIVNGPGAAAAEATPVTVRSAWMGSIKSVVPITGTLQAQSDVNLAAKLAGKVVKVLVREGDSVYKGQLVIQQDPSDYDSQIRQAKAAVKTAQAHLSQTRTQVIWQQTQSSAEVQNARAALAAARARLSLVRSGARTQERAVAENAVNSAQANYDNAQINVKRMRSLFADGAVAQSQVDTAETQFKITEANLASAKEQLSIVKEGARSQEIQTAEAAAEQAQEQFRMARANVMQNALRRQDVVAARAGVAQAQAAVSLAQQQLANTRILSPVSGIVASRSTDPGEVASAGTSLMRIVDLSAMYFEGSVSENQLALLSPGQYVAVGIDAFPGKTYQASVYKIYPAGNTSSRTFTVRVNVPNSMRKLKPGMFARGSVTTSAKNNTVLITKDAVVPGSNPPKVFIVVRDEAIERPFTRGLEDNSSIEALAGVGPGDRLIISGLDKLKDRQKVRVVSR